MRYLLCYSCYDYEFSICDWVESWIANLRGAGIDVKGFCLTLNPPGPCLLWPELDKRWRERDPELLALYEELSTALANRDGLFNWNGINLHPEFVEQLKVFTVYSCFDDPESSAVLSRPVAGSYDLCMVGNAAEVETYRSWGVEHAVFGPLGFRSNDFDPKLTKQQILTQSRSNDVTLCCERKSPHRRERLDKFAANFPQGAYYGHGWPNGFLPESERVPLLQRTRIGINLHNSTGPINFRSYYLPANGVLQICDNKSHLGTIFEIGKEILGYDSIEEAIDLCRYYLAHEDERRRIAAAGFERAQRDYNEIEVFRRMMRTVEAQMKNDSDPNSIEDHLRAVNSALQNGELNLAEKHLEAMCSMAPAEEALRFSLADIRVALGNVEGAIQALDQAPEMIAKDPAFQARRSQFKQQFVPLSAHAGAGSEGMSGLSPSAASYVPISGLQRRSAFRAETFVYPSLRVTVVDTADDLRSYFNLPKTGRIMNPDVDVIDYPDDNFGRKRRDAEVLTTLSANASGPLLELGTSFGHGTYELSQNLPPGNLVYTVNILPEQWVGDCTLVTHLIGKDEIGKHFRERGAANIEQFYENTLDWAMPARVSDLAMIFIDAAHDTEAVFKDSLKTWDRLAPGGFIVWHDFSPLFRERYDWIDAVMKGVTKFLEYVQLDREVVNLRNSWMGILQKPANKH